MNARAAAILSAVRRALRAAKWTVRQRRYAAMSVAMLAIAIGCVVAGTWQLQRYNRSVRINDAIESNAKQPVVALATLGVNLTGAGSRPGPEAIDYRAVDAVGTYLTGPTELVRYQSINNAPGYWVLAPLRTQDGILLVVRGFIAAAADGAPPAVVPPAPSGSVRVTGKLQTSDTSNENLSAAGGQDNIATINATQQSARLNAPVYQAYLLLDADQPGADGLTALPAPDLSNPAGGAPPWQHLAYIIQWYLFALLALGAPFAIARRDVREAQRQYLGIGSAAEELGMEDEDPLAPLEPLVSGPDGVLEVRAPGSLVPAQAIVEARTQRAERLADRYGRSLGVDGGRTAQLARAVARDVAARAAGNATPPPNDVYHDAYNDHLWLLAMADGKIPIVEAPLTEPADETPEPAVVIEAAPPGDEPAR